MMYLKILYFAAVLRGIKAQAGGMGGIDIEFASAFDQDLYKRVINDTECEEQLDFISNNASVSMLFQDASAKIPSGFLGGNFADLGDYFECLGIKYVTKDMDIEGKYCMMQIPLKDLMSDTSDSEELPDLGEFPNITDIFPQLENRTLEDIRDVMKAQQYAQMISGANQPNVPRVIPTNFASALNMSLAACVPKVCQSKKAFEYFLRRNGWDTRFKNSNITYEEFFCRLPNDKPFTIADSLAITILTLIAAITIMSTSFDLFETFALKKKSSEINTLYRSFSVYTNTKRFLTFNKVPGALECVDGIRAISMLWVIFGHTYCLTMLTFVSNVKAVKAWLTSLSSTWINSAPITVDTFFHLSGILCVYTVIGKTTRWRFIKSLHLFYLYRILRILPLLGVVILLQASLFHRFSDGPMWINMGHMTLMCRKRWWSALLHVQNYVKPIGVCLYQTWYLSVDLQLYIVSPAVLVWLFGSTAIAWCALFSAILLAFILSTTYSFLYNYSAALANPSRVDQFGDYFIDYYINTLTRAPPFFIGMMYGYILHRCKGKKLRLRKILVWVTWIFAFILMAFCIFSNYPIMQEDFHVQIFDNFLNAYMRGIWALAVGWMIFACVHGYGGPINWFLSLKMWKLPARLSYAMYLTHYSIMMVANGSMVSTLYFSDGNTLYRAMGDLAFTTIAAFILSITVDAPFSTLQKLLLGGGTGNRKRQKKQTAESQNDNDADAKNFENKNVEHKSDENRSDELNGKENRNDEHTGNEIGIDEHKSDEIEIDEQKSDENRNNTKSYEHSIDEHKNDELRPEKTNL